MALCGPICRPDLGFIQRPSSATSSHARLSFPGTQLHRGGAGDLYKTTTPQTTETSPTHTKAHLANEWNINDCLTVVPLAGRNPSLTALSTDCQWDPSSSKRNAPTVCERLVQIFLPISLTSCVDAWMLVPTYRDARWSVQNEGPKRGSHGSLCPVTSLADGMGTSSGSWHQCHFLEINEIVQIHTDLEAPGDDATLSLKRFGRYKMKTDYWMKLKPKVI